MSDTTSCEEWACKREARMAIRTIRNQRNELKVTVWFDNRTAPKIAGRYCKLHGETLMTGLVKSIVAPDD